MKIELPYPPSTNHYWRHVAVRGRVRVLLSEAGRAYRDAVALAFHWAGRPTAPSGRLAVLIEAHPPDRRKRDLDNLLKGLLDAVTHAGGWADDGLIDRMTIVRCCPVAKGKVVLTVRQEE